MWGMIASGAASLLGSAVNAWMGAEAGKKQEQRLKEQEQILAQNKAAQDKALAEREAKLQAWYEREANADPTQRADAQRLMTYTQEQVRKANQAAAGRQAVMGGTEEAAAAQREQNNKMVADTAAQIAAQNAARKDAVEQRHMTMQDNLDDKKIDVLNQDTKNKLTILERQNQMEQQRYGNVAASIQGGVKAVAGAAGAYGKSNKKS